MKLLLYGHGKGGRSRCGYVRAMELANGCLEIFATLVIFVLLVGMYKKKPTQVFEKRLLALVICHMAVLLLDAARWFLYQSAAPKPLMVVLSVLPTILALVGHAIFVYFAVALFSRRGPVPRIITIPLILLFVFAIASWGVFILLNGVQSAANMQTNYAAMQYSWGYWVGHFGWASVCAIGLGLLWQCRQGLTHKELLSLSSYCVFPLLALVLRFFWDGSQIFLSTSLSIIWIYAVIQREQRQRLWEQENQLAQGRFAILLSQIQPHFIYNTLTAICGLCDENPKEAKQVTAEFADYLRHNLESLGHSTSIPFENELQHTKRYLSIEKKRFENMLHVVYNIETEDFRIPSLSVQPLVENAVKHGVRRNKNGGTISISTKEHKAYYEVCIADDGAGFSLSEEETDKKSHVGIENVRGRLWVMCKGTLTITSIVGEGTHATIQIPKGETVL